MDANAALEVFDGIASELPVGQFEAFVQGVLIRCTTMLNASCMLHEITLATYDPPQPDINDPRR